MLLLLILCEYFYFSVVKQILTSNDLVKQELLTIPGAVRMSVKSVFAADDIGE